MQISRYRSGPPIRPPRRRVGCVPLVILLGVLVGLMVSTRDRIGEWLNVIGTSQTESDLRTAQRAFDRGDLDMAIELARQSWQTDPANTDALTLLVRALVYRSYSDYDRDIDRRVALQTTAAALKAAPQDTGIMAIHAFALQANGDSIRASQFAQRVLNRDPENIIARVTLGLAYGGVGGYENALNENENTVKQATTYRLDAQRALAISLGDVGRYREAMRALDAALKENNRLPLLHFERALYAILDGDTDAATRSYFSVLAFDPDNIKARLRMCELSSLLRESETALQYCTEVTQSAPGWVAGWYRLGREYYLRGEFADAQHAFNRCTMLSVAQDIPVEDRQFDCWYLQGQAAEILHDCDALLNTYNQFLEMAAAADLPQTWTYPPEGPAICTDS